jgi:hypothetical protein
MSKEREFVNLWVAELEYLNIFECDKEDVQGGEFNRLLKEWETVMDGRFRF